MSASTLRTRLELLLADYRAAAAKDPFTNPYLLFALELTRRMASGDVDIAALERVVREIAADGFQDRAARLGVYLGIGSRDPDGAGLKRMFEDLADRGFSAYAEALSRPAQGVVTTAHPTFGLTEDLCLALVELATGQSAEGEILSAEDRAARHNVALCAPHGPPAMVALDVEHAWSVAALTHALDALEEARLSALDVARARWPEKWTHLQPHLLTLATWVGFDQDGRTDVTWRVSVGKRLQLKECALVRLGRRAGGIAGGAQIAVRLDRARDAVTDQLDALSTMGEDPERIAAFARLMVESQTVALADPTPLLAELAAALTAAKTDTDRRALIALIAEVETHGLCIAHIHVRLNAAQLHNAVRREANLGTSPADPANRRTYFAAINKLIGDCAPVAVGFQSLLEEATSARRLFITIAQMKKYIDAAAPVRFLIAETESGFTLLTALYYARLFGVDDIVEISPLFETEEALARGEAVIEEALKSLHFRNYLKRQGKLCIEFGFSDSGRFIGQMAATFRIERLRLRLAELMQREGLNDLELVLFNTHGESIGRGGNHQSLHDRLAYCAPEQSRREFAKRGIRVREEESFQGGDGYLPLFTLPAARATVLGLLNFGFSKLSETDDLIYAHPAYASDFFATVQQAFATLAQDRDYVTLLSLFGTRLLNRTGSRPEQRLSEDVAQVRNFAHVSELRAIPNNAILQGLGDLTNTTFGVSRAAAKDPAAFSEMMERSPRFRQAMEMARTAASLGDLAATRAYAATANPSLWLDRRACASSAETPLLENLAALAGRADMTGGLSRALRLLRAEPAFPLAIEDEPRRDRMRLLHALRITLIQSIAVLAARIPPFTPFAGVTPDDLRVQLLRLEVESTVETLKQRFPAHQDRRASGGNFGETPTYDPGDSDGYGVEHERLFDPLMRIYSLVLKTTTALDHEIGACG
jgi:phosphoenolpyruvate carboxylase